jgi:hypothetical protein
MSVIDRLKQAKKTRESSAVVFSAIGIAENPYLLFIYDQIYLMNRCSEQQFIDTVEAIDEPSLELLNGATHAARFGCKEELAGYLEGIQRGNLPHVDEFLLYLRNV